MHSTVQGHVVMSLVVSNDFSFRIVVDLAYDPADPYAVGLTFHLPGDQPVTWVFARELLLDGISRPAGEGDVHISPTEDADSDVCIVLHSPEGEAMLRTAAPPLLGFLARAGRMLPLGDKQAVRDLEAQLADILGNC